MRLPDSVWFSLVTRREVWVVNVHQPTQAQGESGWTGSASTLSARDSGIPPPLKQGLFRL